MKYAIIRINLETRREEFFVWDERPEYNSSWYLKEYLGYRRFGLQHYVFDYEMADELVSVFIKQKEYEYVITNEF